MLRLTFIILCIFCVVGCSTEKHYKTLSFFFDGVPKPGSQGQGEKVIRDFSYNESVLAAARERHNQIIQHAPYQERSCDICHIPQSMGDLRQEMPGLCYQCHEDFNDRYKYIHGPVSAGYCTSCHHAHNSRNSNLLLREGQLLCYHCHEQKMVMNNEVHADIGNYNCTECHNPHGGEDPFMFH
ncbi:hypothetical protein JIV24_00920 [Carboxylicivirga sp. N1Y132]|uniref:Doubled CXXCH motif domain-containing protein n=2 Tax=Carboxylicivirga marina TaxID=2800988 RepID=A0ABS1HDZ2_9BACT|nr:cytochrome c3 family protein [uncultured Carboxylicivirga sp.]MBK3515882.1 hypothetical protein [Carboxylicivirga marina]